MSRLVHTHESRHAASWLIFDVRQRMIALALILCGGCGLAAVASLLYGVTAEDGHNGQRLAFCVIAIVLAAIPTIAICIGEEVVRGLSDGMWNHRTASVVAIIAFSFFTFLSIAGAIPRGRRPKSQDDVR